MNEIDPDKKWRMEQEIHMMYIPFVESVGSTLLTVLQQRYGEIFSKRGGKLTVEIPTDGPPNARVTTTAGKPFEPTIEIRLSMLLEIYKDAFAFPLISSRLEKEHQIVKTVNEQFKGADFTFDDAIPEISDHLMTGPIAEHCAAMAERVIEKSDLRMGRNDVFCRFLLFEIMVVWTFFHELSHVLQQHHAVRSRLVSGKTPSDYIDEMEGGDHSDADIQGQAREIFADVEGIQLTLTYLAKEKRLNYASTYLLLCGMSCMFQRFYNKHEANLNITSGQHPHPVIRDEFAQAAALNWVTAYLLESGTVATRIEAANPLAYYSARASLFSGLYRANRIEKWDGSKLPSYMALVSRDHDEMMRDYVRKVAVHINEQAPMIKDLHVNPSGAVELLLQCLRNMTSAGESKSETQTSS